MVSIQNLRIRDFPFTLGFPQTISAQIPIFQWDLSGSPSKYGLQIQYGGNDFNNPLIYLTSIITTATEFSLYPEYILRNEGIYYARMRGYDGSWGTWSSILQFNLLSIGPNPPTINPVTSPADDFCQNISGTKSGGLYVFVRNNGSMWSEATYGSGLTGTLWNKQVKLSSGNNLIEVATSVSQSVAGTLSRIVTANIYMATIVPDIYNVWNCFDELGLLLGLSRIPGEKNMQYKSRLLEAYTNLASSTYIGLKYGISRELGIDINSVSVDKLSDLMDPNYTGNLLNKDGDAIGTKLEGYADEVYTHNPIFFGTIISDESFWDGVDRTTNGYSYLPHLWDPSASGVYSKWQKPGIGDHDDLWVGSPIKVWNESISDFSWYFRIHSGFFYAANPSGLLV